jgi:ubiquinone/menaquinone biosynthesis C-methylase UbiE
LFFIQGGTLVEVLYCYKLRLRLFNKVHLSQIGLNSNSNNQEGKILKYQEIGRQKIEIENFTASGLILDLGGGGEGVIGQLKGSQVIAVDPSLDELKEASPGPQKVVMDARKLLFPDQYFQTVTSFFTMMYIPSADHKRVLSETYRVIDSRGKFLIWDLNWPAVVDRKKEIGVIYLEVSLPDRTIDTGYGTRWPKQPMNSRYYQKLAREAGFKIGKAEAAGPTFFLELIK